MRTRKWRPTETAILKERFKEGKSDSEIAYELCRTESAIKNMRARLDLVSYKMEEDEPLPLSMILSQKEKEQRLYRLMERLAVRLG